MSTEVTLVLDNVRSAHNVGTILRTADAAGIKSVWLCGLTPTPPLPGDRRPRYVQERAAKQLAKTALGAEQTLGLHYAETATQAIKQLKDQGNTITVLEQSPSSISLFGYHRPTKMALVVGHEVNGVNQSVLSQANAILEIPMHGTKESLNVAIATGIALYQLMQ